MITYRKVPVEEYHQESITCDRCKRTYNDIMDLQEFFMLYYTPGYNNKFFPDSSEVECELCPECLYNLVGKFCRIK